MFTIAIHLSLIELSVLLVVAIIFGLAVHFFIASRRSLLQTLEATGQRPQKPLPEKKQKKELIPAKKTKAIEEEYAPRLSFQQSTAFTTAQSSPREDLTQDLKTTIAQQQKQLSALLLKVEQIEQDGKEELKAENEELQEEIKHLEGILEKKNEEMAALKQQAAMAQKMSARIEEVYAEFEHLQSKMQAMEMQASRANKLAIELEDAREAFEQVHKEVARKQERMEELFMENQRLQQELNVIEDKLAESNLQRQQMQKKIQFLQDLNTDMQSMSDTNTKLQTELRRIGELESMLNMISEERDYLLRKKTGK